MFNGREYDTDTKLYYVRARWYDPEVGRWISEEPIGFAGQDTNLYRYVTNSPVNYTDPSGLKFQPGSGFGDIQFMASKIHENLSDWLQNSVQIDGTRINVKRFDIEFSFNNPFDEGTRKNAINNFVNKTFELRDSRLRETNADLSGDFDVLTSGDLTSVAGSAFGNALDVDGRVPPGVIAVGAAGVAFLAFGQGGDADNARAAFGEMMNGLGVNEIPVRESFQLGSGVAATFGGTLNAQSQLGGEFGLQFSIRPVGPFPGGNLNIGVRVGPKGGAQDRLNIGGDLRW